MTSPQAQRQGTYDNYADAITDASFRAAMTRRRYRVRKDIANQLWHLQETQLWVSGPHPLDIRLSTEG